MRSCSSVNGTAAANSSMSFCTARIAASHEDEPLPLPNLDYQIMQGNSLLESFEGIDLSRLSEPARVGIQLLGSAQGEFGLAAEQTEMTDGTASRADLADLQQAYFDCHDPEEKARLRARIDDAVLRAIDFEIERRREALAAALENWTREIARKKRANKGQYEATAAEEKKRAAWQAELADLTAKSARLHKLRAAPRAERPFFLWRLWFREIFATGGFDTVVSNPPYIPMETMAEDDRRTFQATYAELTRKFDSAAVFILHGLGLLKPSGCLTFISSITWQTGENYAELRRTLFRKAGLRLVINLPFDIFAEAYVDTCIYLITSESAPSYQISILPKRAKVNDFATVPFVEVASELVCEPSFKLVLNPAASALLKRILATPGVLALGAISKSTQGLAGNRFRRIAETGDESPMAFAEDVSVTRYGVGVHQTSVVAMSEHRSLVEFYGTGPKFLIRRIISRQDRLIVARCDEEIVFKKDVSPFLLTNTSIHPDYLLALLNSRLLSWLYVNTSSIATKDDFRQTTLTELRALPIPAAPPAEQATLSALVDRIHAAKRAGDEATVKALEAEIDTHVFRLYGLTAEERTLIEGAAK